MKTFMLLLQQALHSILNNKARSFLTMLGIAIAVFVVVAVDSISNGLAQSTNERFSNLDPTRITISSQEPLTAEEAEEEAEEQPPQNNVRQTLGGGQQVAQGNESLTAIDLDDIIAIDTITNASPLSTTQEQTTLPDESLSRTTVSGVSTAYAELEEFSFAAGQFFSNEEQSTNEAIAVIDYDLSVSLFESAQASIGKTITLLGDEFTIVGVLAEPAEDEQQAFGGRGGGGQTSTAYIPYTRFAENQDTENIASIVAEASSEDLVETSAEAILAALYENHDITNADSDVTISTAAEALSTISGIAESQSKSDKFIGWIVLLVGGIGIMNIMLVTVSERTKEIGLRKAVGAKNKHIVIQFLAESIALTLMGGGAGLLLAAIFSGQVTDIFEIQAAGPGRGATETVAIVDTTTVIVALSASVLAGIIFGLYPAIKASRKDPVESLRYE